MVGENKNFMTRRTKARLETELVLAERKLAKSLMDISEAAGSASDWHDNAAFDQANADHDVNTVLVREAKQKLKDIVVVEPCLETDQVRIGNVVEISFEEDDKKYKYVILGEFDSGTEKEWISYKSPLGLALMDKKIGEWLELNSRKAIIRRISPGDFYVCRVVFVDLGGVLIINKAKEVGDRYESLHGLTKEMTREIFHFVHHTKRNDGELLAFLDEMRVDPELWKNFTKDFYNSESRNEELYDKLKKLKSEGVRVLITTNNGSGARKVAERYGVSDIIDGFISSAEIGFAKPDKKYWEISFEEAKKLVPDLIRNEVLVFDDSHENYISAIDFGFQAIEYGPAIHSRPPIADS